MRYKGFIVAGIVVFLVAIGVVLVKNYFDSTYSVTVSFKNTSKVEVVETPEGAAEKVIGTIVKSGDSTRVNRNSAYLIRYAATEGYADGFVPVDSSNTNVTLDPDYSDARYRELQKAAQATVTSQITAQYPDAPKLFSFEPGLMFDHAKWYVVLLKYKGSYDTNTDNLMVLFKKDGDNWKLVSKPRILLTTHNTPDVPADVLAKAVTVQNGITEEQQRR